MAKITLSDVSNILGNPTSAANTINANNDLIEQALDLLVSRDGESPNQMTADVDLNHNDIINVDNIHADVLVLNGQTVTPTDLAVLPETVMLKTVYDPQGKGADAFDSNNTDYRFSFQDGVIERSVSDRLRDEVSVRDFGASSAVNSSPYINAMALALGYVRFPRGETLVGSNLTIDVPVYFADGAYVTIAAARTLTITDVIDSPKQHIFRGDGVVVLNHDADSGEQSRQLHISWFGSFPGVDTDQAPTIQKAFDAVGNLRESVIDFDVGNYLMSSGVSATRGAWVRGSGTRRTVFLVDTDGFDVFTTAETACRFSDIQFENKAPLTTRASGAFIRVSHSFCELTNIFHQSATNGIIVDAGGSNCRIREVNGVYPTDPAANSSTLLIQASGADVSGVYSQFSNNGPDAIVEISGAATISSTRIDNVRWICDSIGVLVHANNNTISRTMLTNIVHRGSIGTPAQAIKLLTSGTGTITGVTIDDFGVAANAVAGITLEQNSTGSLEKVTISDGYVAGGAGNGIEFIRTAGLLSNIRVSATANFRDRANPVFYSGSNSNILVDPLATVGSNTAGVHFRSSVANNTAFSIQLGFPIFSGIAMITAGVVEMGIFGIRAASTPAVGTNRITDANVVAVATALTGTTGVAGNLTLGVQDGVLYVENQTGSAQNISLSVMGA